MFKIETKYECKPGYPYECDFWLAISYELIMRGEEIQVINRAYKEHEYRNLGHRCNLVEVDE